MLLFSAGLLAGVALGYLIHPAQPSAPAAGLASKDEGKSVASHATKSAVADSAEAGQRFTPGVAREVEAETAAASPVPSAPAPSSQAGTLGTIEDARAAVTEFTKKHSSPSNTAGSREAVQMLMMKLRIMGDNGLTAMQEFLISGNDVKFGNGWSWGGNRIDSPSLRIEMIKTLGHFGEKSIPLQKELLNSTASIVEVGILARNLESAAPGKYQPEVLQAMREVLADPANAGFNEAVSFSVVASLIERYKAYDMIPNVITGVAKTNSVTNVSHLTPLLAQLPPDQKKTYTLQLLNDPQMAQTMSKNPWVLSSLASSDPQVSSRILSIFASSMEERHKEQFIQSLPNHPGVMGNQFFGENVTVNAEDYRKKRAERTTIALELLPQISRLANTPVLQQRIKEVEAQLNQMRNAMGSTQAPSAVRR